MKPGVADCFRTRIGYTLGALEYTLHCVADCFRTRIGYTTDIRSAPVSRLRIAFGLGSVTLVIHQTDSFG